MNESKFSNLNVQAETFSNYLSLFFKLGTFLGALCFTLYCYKLNYFPTGITISDSLLFIIFAGSFCLIYGFIVLCLSSLGICITYFLKPVFKFTHQHYKQYKLNKGILEIPDPIEFIKPKIIHFILAILGIAFIDLMYKLNSDLTVMLSLLSTTFFLSILWSGYQNNRQNLNKVNQQDSPFSITKQEKESKDNEWVLLGLMCIIPLFFSGVSGNVLDAGMRFSNLNIGTSYILVKSPYDKVIPKNYQVKEPIYFEKGFTEFENINVKLSGIGQKTVIQFISKGEKSPKSLAIPNDKIIVLPLLQP